MLGISIYPDKREINEIIEYLDLAHKYGYKRVFTCLLSINDSKENILIKFKTIISHARNYGMEVVLDVSPSVFSALGISYEDLSFFEEMGATAIRLDGSFNGIIESKMSYNPQNLQIELNMSHNVPYLDNISAYKPNMKNIIGSHNFYPQKYTGLSYDFFVKCSERYRKYGVRTAAFINSNVAEEGPWPVAEGLCTLEMHRDLSSKIQLKHMYATGLIDDVIIANQFASDSELKELSEIDPNIMSFTIEIPKNSECENIILFQEAHSYRGEVNEYLVRSSDSRVKFRGEDFPAHDNNSFIPRGSVVIGNDSFGQYKGELQIVLKDIIDEKCQRNVVGKIIAEEMFLLDFLKPLAPFKFEKQK